jgi:hypothetical protein
MEDPNGSISLSNRKPLSHVVSDCMEHWFLNTFKEARTGDPAMMVLVAQILNSGYRVAKNEQKVWYYGGPTSDLLYLCPFLCHIETHIVDLISVVFLVP